MWASSWFFIKQDPDLALKLFASSYPVMLLSLLFDLKKPPK